MGFICYQCGQITELHFVCPLQKYWVRHGDIDMSTSQVIKQTIRLSEPIVTNKIKLNIVKGGKDGKAPIVFKMNVLGMPPDKKYKADSMLDEATFNNCKFRQDLLDSIFT